MKAPRSRLLAAVLPVVAAAAAAGPAAAGEGSSARYATTLTGDLSITADRTTPYANQDERTCDGSVRLVDNAKIAATLITPRLRPRGISDTRSPSLNFDVRFNSPQGTYTRTIEGAFTPKPDRPGADVICQSITPDAERENCRFQPGIRRTGGWPMVLLNRSGRVVIRAEFPDAGVTTDQRGNPDRRCAAEGMIGESVFATPIATTMTWVNIRGLDRGRSVSRSFNSRRASTRRGTRIVFSLRYTLLVRRVS
jgi:hypothetical protein